MDRISSPDARSVRSVLTMGSPAPIVPSHSHFAPDDVAAVRIALKRFKSPLLAFLLGVTTCTPLASQPSYRSATA